MKLIQKQLAAVCCALWAMASAQAQTTLNIDAGQRGPAIGDRHYGLFFEEINHAGDGGLYAELIQNRSFEDNANNPDKWWTVGGASMSLVTQDLLNDAQQHALQLVMTSAGDGVRNEGFWGINVVAGQTYKLSFWLRAATTYSGQIVASLQTSDGTVLGSTDIAVEATGQWTKYTAEITSTGSDRQGWLALTGSKPGTVWLDVVSLFPPTYKDRENGCRKDLAEMLAATKPAFVRFPGGCYVEGASDGTNTNRFEWKNTVGPIEERPGHLNNNWGYRVSDGFGFHEMLQLAEDIGAEPLFVVNIGMGHGWVADYQDIDEYIQEALDALEYCNGDPDTTQWGALRAKNGHPAPFNLRLLEIGNENCNFIFDSNADQSDHYAERYEQFRQAIKARYPDVTLIGNVEAWGTDNPSWRNSYPVDAVDEHYYRSPSWFVSQYNKYDSYSRSNYKVYVGEYAVTQDYGINGHLNAALGEAVYMLGMENNSDVCIMNSYAPIFVNENNYNWRPDMIRFNSYTSYGTPSYYVQQLFPNNLGKQNVKWTEEGNTYSSSGLLGLSTWSTSASFDNVTVTDNSTDSIIFADDFGSAKADWIAPDGGVWTVSDGTLKQTDAAMQGQVYLCNVQPGQHYTYQVEATKVSGSEGFLIVFNYADATNYCWWNLGGWNNTAHAVEVCSNGSKSTVASASGSLETGRTYRIKIVVDGSHVQCYLDEQLLHDFTLPTDRRVYVASSIDDTDGILYLKMVNTHPQSQDVTVHLANATVTTAAATVLSSSSGLDENTLDNPTNVVPRVTALPDLTGQQFSYQAPPYSVNILRLSVSDVQIVSQSDEAAQSLLSDCRQGLPTDLTPLLTNPDFSQGATGWAGTTFTQAREGVAEFWNTTFDKYQILRDMPAGTYRLQAQGFYRFGDIVPAYTAHQDGTEQLLAQLYINDASAPFSSLFSETDSYTYEPFTYPNDVTTANAAFNTDSAYASNFVELQLLEDGDLRIGVRKTDYCTNDWTIFDNFTLLFTGRPSAIVGPAEAEPRSATATVDVYSLSGQKLRTSESPSAALNGLPKGIYIVGKQKVVVR